jgi:hypothetical protein
MTLTFIITLPLFVLSVTFPLTEVVSTAHSIDHKAKVVNKTGFSKDSSSMATQIEVYGTNHVIFNEEGLDLYTAGQWTKFVHSQDSFMLMSGNRDGKIDTVKLNQWAGKIRARYPLLQIYAATSGVANVRHAGELDVDLFTGLIMVYEPGFPNAPEFTWEQKHTEEIWREAAAFIRSKGLEAWAKPSGRGLDGRSKEGEWDYGILATLMDGMNVQTQGSCRNDTYSQALYDLVSQYEALGATSDLLVQLTVGTNARHGVLAPKAIDCAKEAWDKVQIDRVTLWPDMSDQREVEDYLELKEKLQAQEE